MIKDKSIKNICRYRKTRSKNNKNWMDLLRLSSRVIQKKLRNCSEILKDEKLIKLAKIKKRQKNDLVQNTLMKKI